MEKKETRYNRYYKRHRERRINDAKEYHKKNKDKIRETKRKYRQNNPDKIAHLKARRSARERGAKGGHTLKEWNDLKKKFNNRCAFCFKERKLTKDHILPLIAGGSDYIENIQPLCRECNSRKGKSIKFNKENILATFI